MTDSPLHAFFKGKTILVTGGAGFIGSALIRTLFSYAATIICVSRKKLSDGKTRSHIKNIVGDYSVLFWKKALKGVDIVYHFAAQTSASYAEIHPTEDFRSNVVPIVSLIAACQQTGFRPIVVLSGSVTQTGLTTKKAPVGEGRGDFPITIYDVSKLVAEQYLGYYARHMGGRGVTLRLANVYGPGPTSGSADRGILNLMVRKALKGEDLTIYGPGAYTRDYIYIEDVIVAFLSAAANISKTNGKYYVVGSGKGNTVARMIALVSSSASALTGKKSKVIHVPQPKDLPRIEHRHFVADTSRLSRDTGWRVRVNLKTGIQKTLEFYLKQL